MTKTSKILIIIFIVLLLVLGFILLRSKNTAENTAENKSGKQTSQTASSTVATSTSVSGTTTTSVMTPNGPVGFNITGNGNYKVELVPMDTSRSVPKPIPDLYRPVKFNTSLALSPEVKAMITQKIITLQTAIRKTPTYLAGYVDLGIYEKMAGDYQAALLYWQYAGRLQSSNFVSFGNIGDLYAYYLHDATQSETYYKQAISKGPTQVYLYVQLVAVYRDVFHDLTRARAIIEQGLLQVPNDSNLLQLKASLSQS